jgi:hypothetical protein
MLFWNGRLYCRWFTPESGALGADTFVASGAGDGRNWTSDSGMTMASGRLVYATTTGTLSTVDFTPASHRLRHRAQRPGRRRPVLAVQGVVRPLSVTRSGPHPSGCVSDPFRYPAPRQPL